MTRRIPLMRGLMILSILLGGMVGCAPASTQPAATSAPTLPDTQPTVPPAVTSAPGLPAGWETHSARADQGQCGYAIDHPSDMDASSQGTYNWLLSPAAAEPGGLIANFIYISVIPDDFQSSEPGLIYNYDPAETQTLLNMQVGESRSLREDPTIAPSFTYTRLPDTAPGGQAAQAYENNQPWEFPPGTKEIRYYLQAQGCTYMVGGYMSTVGSGQTGTIDQELFDQIIATFRPVP